MTATAGSLIGEHTRGNAPPGLPRPMPASALAPIRYMQRRWPDLVGTTDAAVSGRVNRAINARGGPMLERDGEGQWQLTPRAVELLTNTTKKESE